MSQQLVITAPEYIRPTRSPDTGLYETAWPYDAGQRVKTLKCPCNGKRIENKDRFATHCNSHNHRRWLENYESLSEWYSEESRITSDNQKTIVRLERFHKNNIEQLGYLTGENRELTLDKIRCIELFKGREIERTNNELTKNNRYQEITTKQHRMAFNNLKNNYINERKLAKDKLSVVTDELSVVTDKLSVVTEQNKRFISLIQLYINNDPVSD